MSGHDRDLPPELAEVGERLRNAKPRLSPLELDRVKGTTTRIKGNYMKARLTILAALVVGMLMMGTGGALAGSAISTGSTAATVEYPDNGGGGVLGKQNSGGGGNGPTASAETAQTTRQVASSGSGTLPFTGFLAIPVLLVGVGLVGSGVVLRRRLDPERRS